MQQGTVCQGWQAYNDRVVVLCLQHEYWKDIVPLASGANGAVFHTACTLYPHVVLKRGWQHHLWEEADKMWRCRHPNIVTLYSRIETGEVGLDGIPVAWLALQRCGPTLAAVKASRTPVFGRHR